MLTLDHSLCRLWLIIDSLTVVEPRFSGYDNVVDLDDEKSRRSFNRLLKDLDK